jgi:predicted Zn-dependent peptidase
LKRSILILLSVVFSAALFAQDAITNKDKNGNEYTSYSNDPTNSRWYTLDNGLTVILAPNHTKPRVQTLIATKAGSSSDPSTNTGLAHYLEHMLFKGTDKYGSLDFEKEQALLSQIDALYDQYNHTKDEAERKHIYHIIDSVSGEAAKYAIANEYDRMLQGVGAQGTNAFTSFERTVYVNDVPANQIHTWLDIEAERFRNPILRLFHTELEAVYEEKNRSLDSDNSKVYESLFEASFPNHNYGRQTTIGVVEHLKNPSLIKIREYYHTYYVPNNMAIILAGDIDPAQTYEWIKNKFSYMVAKEVPTQTFEDDPALLSPHKIEITGPSAESITMGYRVPDALSKEANLIHLIDMILSNSKAGLIDLNMVKAQKCLRAYSSTMLLKERGLHYFSGSPLEGQSLEELEQLFYDQINLIKTGQFNMDLIQSIVLNQKVSEIKRFDSYQGTAYTLMDAFIMGKDWSKKLNSLDQMLLYTKEDITSFANKYYIPGNIVVYKRKGEKEESAKIEKPEITKVEVNRGETSDFTSDILSREKTPATPQFLDYKNDIEFSSLGKNIPVWKVKEGDDQLFSLYYVLDIGSFHDQKLALAVEYLKFLGTDQYSSDDIATEFYKLACNFGVSTGREQSYVYLNGLASSFDDAIQLFEHLLANAQPDQAKLDQMIAKKLKARADSKLNKGRIMSRLRSYALYGEQNPSNYIISNDNLSTIKASELTDYIHSLNQFQHKIWYSGPLSSKTLNKCLKKYHSYPKTFKETPQLKEFKMKDVTESTIYFAHYDMVQAEIMWLKKSNVLNIDEAADISLFNEYFGGGMSSIVFQEIRESKALAYSTYSYYAKASKLGDDNFVMAYIGTQADKLSDGVDAMNELLTNLPEDEGKFENGKSALRQNLETSRVLKTSILFDYDKSLKLGFTEDPRKQLASRLETVTLDDIVKFHNDKIKGQYQFALVGSKDKIDFEKLKSQGTLKTISLEELFGY